MAATRIGSSTRKRKSGELFSGVWRKVAAAGGGRRVVDGADAACRCNDAVYALGFKYRGGVQ
jgi:hypothetical protein